MHAEQLPHCLKGCWTIITNYQNQIIHTLMNSSAISRSPSRKKCWHITSFTSCCFSPLNTESLLMHPKSAVKFWKSNSVWTTNSWTLMPCFLWNLHMTDKCPGFSISTVCIIVQYGMVDLTILDTPSHYIYATIYIPIFYSFRWLLTLLCEELWW